MFLDHKKPATSLRNDKRTRPAKYYTCIFNGYSATGIFAKAAYETKETKEIILYKLMLCNFNVSKISYIYNVNDELGKLGNLLAQEVPPNSVNTDAYTKRLNGGYGVIMYSLANRDCSSLIANQQHVVRVGNYVIKNVIGRGNFAVVKLAVHEQTKHKVAIKMIDKSQLGDDNLKKLYREIDILKRLNHPHIIKLYQVLETSRMLYMITEYASRGEIYDYLKTHGRMTEGNARKLFRQILSAIAYCHAMRVVHRDLKAENLLLDADMNIKVADFGFGNHYDPNHLLSTWCGSPPYAAPELFEGLEYDGTKADIWSLGIVLYIMVCGGFPFPGDSVEHLKQAVQCGSVDIPFYISVECADLIRKMLVVDPDQRINMERIAAHRWVRHDDWRTVADLFTGSLLGDSSGWTGPLDRSICVAAEGYGFGRAQVEEAVVKGRFDKAYAIYHILCDQHHKPWYHEPSNIHSDGSKLSATSPDASDLMDQPRRGSITGGLTPTMVCEDGVFSPAACAMTVTNHEEAEGDDGAHMDYMEDDAPSPSADTWKRLLAMRRKTDAGIGPAHSIGVTGRPSCIPSSAFVGPLQNNLSAAWQSPSFAPPPVVSTNPRAPCLLTAARARIQRTALLGLVSPVMTSPYLAGQPYSADGRRASSADIPLTALCALSSAHDSSSSPVATVEVMGDGNHDEELRRYQRSRGASKRHTVHTLYTSGSPVHDLTHLSRAPSPYHRLTLHPAGNVDRRGSDGPAISPQALERLERLYNQAQMDNPSHSVKQLQHEFRQLQTTAGEPPQTRYCPNQSSPPRTVRSSDGSGGSRGVSPRSSSPALVSSGTGLALSRIQEAHDELILPTGSHRSVEGVFPRIDITPPSPLDALSSYQLRAQQILAAGTPTTSSSPAMDCSSDDDVMQQFYAPPVTAPSHDYRSRLTVSSLLAEIKRSLDRLHIINYNDDGGVRGDGVTSSVGQDNNECRRLSLESDDGTRVEIGVQALPYGSGTGSRLKVHCLSGSADQYERLCTQLSTSLQLIS